jgi:imidazolonepropionase-like amidohydrolase
LFEGARLIVGDGSVLESGAFVVDGGRFPAVDRRGLVKLPAGAVRVDLTGKTVMPTIIDGHGHLGYNNARNGTGSLENYTRENLIESMQRAAYYGVGAYLSMGNDGGHGDLPWTLRDEDIPDGARWLTVGPGIGSPGNGQGGVRANSWTTVRSAAEARKAVQELVPHNPVFVKIWVDDRVGTVEATPPAIYEAVIDEAHKNSIRVIAHTNLLKHAKGLVRAGADGFAHMVRDRVSEIDDELIQLLKGRPGFLVTPVLPAPGNGDPGYAEADLPWIGETIPPSQIEQMRKDLARPDSGGDRYTRGEESFRMQAKNLMKLKAAGLAKIGLGTDSGAGWTAHTEMAEMVRAGMTPADVIVSATSNMADILRLDDMAGSRQARAPIFLFWTAIRSKTSGTRDGSSTFI